MERLLQVGLSNAAAATGLALLAFLAARLLRRPPITRALWLLVLLKLLTPPLWTFHVPLPGSISRATTASHAIVPPTERALPAQSPQRPIVEPVLDHVPDEVMNEVARAETSQSPPPVITPKISIRGALAKLGEQWRFVIWRLWVGGSILYLLLVLWSAARLRRLVVRSRVAPPDVVHRTTELASRLGLRRPPRVRFADAPVPPMLCAIGRPALLLVPSRLWETLTEGQRDAVLAHEMAHLRRGDHWVRLFELCVSALYWWLPIVWWGRRELREATEQCCDAWVLSEMPRSARSYATALIEAIDFISAARPAVPALASGMGQFTDLKRRLVMINRGTVRRAMSWPAFAGVCGVAALLLPLAPAFGQVAGAGPAVQSATDPGQTVAVSTTVDGEVAHTPPIGLPVVSGDRAEVAGQLQEARADVERLRADLAHAEARLAMLERGYWPSKPGSNATSTEDRLDRLERQVQQMMNELRRLREDIYPGGGRRGL